MERQHLRPLRPWALALLAYALLTVAYTWPLPAQALDQVPADPFDPILNASILWWNATVVPFSTTWWSPPHFFPVENVAAFTENLAGLGVISSPIVWLTGQPILAYNLTFFLTWTLSAFAAYLLARSLVRRDDAAFIAGLAFGFATYRLSQIGHLQVLASFWLPLALLGLHSFLKDRRARWLVLFGTAWLLQSLSNGYYMFYGAVLIALWLLYFGSQRAHRRDAIRIVAAWLVASIPLAAVMWKYRLVHQTYGLTRGVDAAISMSAQPSHWLQVTDLSWFWWRFFGESGPESSLFPGITAIALVIVAGVGFLLRRDDARAESQRRRAVRIALVALALLCVAAAVIVLVLGPVRINLGITLRMSGASRSLLVATAAVAGFVALMPGLRQRLHARSPFVFYALATIVIAVLACGPEIHRGKDVLFGNAPYRWLMMVLPGLEGLRVVARFWMIGALCLAAASACAFAWLVPRSGMAQRVAFSAVCLGLFIDGWRTHMPLVPAPVMIDALESSDVQYPILELPLGPKWDAAATFRAVGHRRRVVNGVSGYDPPHYQVLQRGLDARDPSVLLALASLGTLDVVLDRANDPDGGLVRMVEGIDRVTTVREDGPRVLYRIPRSSPPVDGAGALFLELITPFRTSRRVEPG